MGIVVFGSFDGGILQPVFSIIAKNSEADKKEEFKKVVYDTLNDIVKNGIDKNLIEGCINAFEFQEVYILISLSPYILLHQSIFLLHSLKLRTFFLFHHLLQILSKYTLHLLCYYIFLVA